MAAPQETQSKRIHDKVKEQITPQYYQSEVIFLKLFNYLG